MTELIPIHFYADPVEVLFDSLPAREKTPDCPNGFIWEGKSYRILETLSEWSDFTRRGKFARNMRPAHAAVASTRGSLNVGRFYFRYLLKKLFQTHLYQRPLDLGLELAEGNGSRDKTLLLLPVNGVGE